MKLSSDESKRMTFKVKPSVKFSKVREKGRAAAGFEEEGCRDPRPSAAAQLRLAACAPPAHCARARERRALPLTPLTPPLPPPSCAGRTAPEGQVGH